MRWLRRHHDDPDGRASEALAETRERLEEVRERRVEGRGVLASLRAFRETNHLAERVRDALGGTP